jgi:predicted CopG family antitoxin
MKKDIKVEEDTWKKLTELKFKEKFKSIDSLIIKLLEKYNGL